MRPAPGGLIHIDDHATAVGVMPFSELTPGLCRTVTPPPQGADAAIAHAVEDEGEKLSGRGHPGDLVAPSGRDPLVGGSDGRPSVVANNRLRGRPAHKG